MLFPQKICAFLHLYSEEDKKIRFPPGPPAPYNMPLDELVTQICPVQKFLKYIRHSKHSLVHFTGLPTQASKRKAVSFSKHQVKSRIVLFQSFPFPSRNENFGDFSIHAAVVVSHNKRVHECRIVHGSLISHTHTHTSPKVTVSCSDFTLDT